LEKNIDAKALLVAPQDLCRRGAGVGVGAAAAAAAAAAAFALLGLKVG
jgi:hypothetical protein